MKVEVNVRSLQYLLSSFSVELGSPSRPQNSQIRSYTSQLTLKLPCLPSETALIGMTSHSPVL